MCGRGSRPSSLVLQMLPRGGCWPRRALLDDAANAQRLLPRLLSLARSNASGVVLWQHFPLQCGTVTFSEPVCTRSGMSPNQSSEFRRTGSYLLLHCKRRHALAVSTCRVRSWQVVASISHLSSVAATCSCGGLLARASVAGSGWTTGALRLQLRRARGGWQLAHLSFLSSLSATSRFQLEVARPRRKNSRGK
jgi:hypothetical protein